MSEELIQRRLTLTGEAIGPYEYYNIGNTSISQLKKFNIVPARDYGPSSRNKPDGVLVDRRDRKNVIVIAVVEHKTPAEFDTPRKRQNAVEQCIFDTAKPLRSKVAVVTDGLDYLWINPQPENEKKYETVLREDGYPLDVPFKWDTEDQRDQIQSLLRKLIEDLSTTNSRLVRQPLQNPSNLADRCWQTIWLASGENPDSCLATFVEIFVFKYLSDLKVLVTNDTGAAVSFSDVLAVNRDRCLKYYFSNVREYIKALFPANAEDDTSIINGTVLNPEIAEHNTLFHNILLQFRAFGPLSNIDPEFKSRLYENFLKKSISQKNWGQFFTPRNIVKANLRHPTTPLTA